MSIAQRLKIVEAKIAQAAKKSGRKAEDILLIPVSKTWDATVLDSAFHAGIRVFGENYVQEAVGKIEKLDPSIQWHYIGHLQSNKVKAIINKFAWIHSIDSKSVIKEFDKRLQDIKTKQKVLLQVQYINENSKSGVPLHEVPIFLEEIQKTQSLQLCGLMWMPPLEMPSSEKRKHFQGFYNQKEKWQSLVGGEHHLQELSLGTTNDYELAIEEGSTMVRVGSAIFGERIN